MSAELEQTGDASVIHELLQRLARDIHAMTEARYSTADPATQAQAARRHAEENTAFLKAVIDAHGWPTAARFGDQAQAAAGWLLAFSAAIDPEFQNACLEQLGWALAAGAVDAEFFAFTTDRVLLSQGRAQRYGTQVQMRESYNVITEPVEEPARLNARRRAIGLKPLRLVSPDFRPAPTGARQRPPRRTTRTRRRR